MIRNVDFSSKNVMLVTHRGRDSRLVESVIKLIDETNKLAVVDYNETDASSQIRTLATSGTEWDLVILVAPVYNASYPGNLKNALDFVPREVLAGIPVTSVLYAGGPRFGMVWSATYHPWLHTIGMDFLPDYIYLDEKDRRMFEDFDELMDNPEFLSLVIDPFLEGISKKLEID